MPIPVRIIAILFSALVISGCGAPGAPLPPSLGIPKPVSDLRAARTGDTAIVSWTAPTETTDGELVRRTGKIALLRSLSGDKAPQQWQTLSQVPLPPALKQDQTISQGVHDDLSSLLTSGANFALYSVLAESNTGRNAGTSNQVSIPLVPSLPTPMRVSAVPVPLGISISWDQAWPPQNQSHLTVQYVYRIMRHEEGAKADVAVKEVGAGNQAMALVDSGIEWQKNYQYWIVPVTVWQGDNRKGEFAGPQSPVVSVFANDTFPPAIPAGLEAVYSGTGGQPGIDLSWTPDTEPDLAGYNVYRRLENEAPVKLNTELVKTSSYRDNSVSPGNKYFYSVSAIDQRGNESGKSVEASESVPN